MKGEHEYETPNTHMVTDPFDLNIFNHVLMSKHSLYFQIYIPHSYFRFDKLHDLK